MGILGFLNRGPKDVGGVGGGAVEYWKPPLLKMASSCEHVAGPRHRFILLDLMPLVKDLTRLLPAGTVVGLGGIQVGRFGLVLQGHAALDFMAVQRNVLWEDEHCLVCCGALLRFKMSFLDDKALTRCGPTIGTPGIGGASVLGSVVDEYWTD